VRRLRLLAVLIPLVMATGCGFKPEPIGSLPSFPQTVTDGAGRRVTVESQPRRVVSLDAGLTESAFAVGGGGLIVAGSGNEQYPAAALRLPRAAGSGGGTPSVARLRRLRPDLVLMPNGTAASAAAAVQRGVGAPVYVAGEATVSGIEHDVDGVGALTGNAGAAGRLVGRMQAQLRAVKAAVAAAGPAVPVFVDEGFFYTIDPDGVGARLIELAGGTNVASDAVPGKPFPLPRLRAAAPQAYLAVAGRGVSLAGLRQSKATRDLPAVRNRRFSLIDAGALTDTGPRVVAEVRRLARLLHPSLHIR
jgi:iron complex transport system substrate-binding protein